jgi:hypothetical protein
MNDKINLIQIFKDLDGLVRYSWPDNYWEKKFEKILKNTLCPKEQINNKYLKPPLKLVKKKSEYIN